MTQENTAAEALEDFTLHLDCGMNESAVYELSQSSICQIRRSLRLLHLIQTGECKLLRREPTETMQVDADDFFDCSFYKQFTIAWDSAPATPEVTE